MGHSQSCRPTSKRFHGFTICYPRGACFCESDLLDVGSREKLTIQTLRLHTKEKLYETYRTERLLAKRGGK